MGRVLDEVGKGFLGRSTDAAVQLRHTIEEVERGEGCRGQRRSNPEEILSFNRIGLSCDPSRGKRAYLFSRRGRR